MGHAQTIAHHHAWRDLVHELRTGEYETSAVWDLVDAVCMGTLLLMVAGSVLSIIALVLIDVV
jgi:hypothetical protein